LLSRGRIIYLRVSAESAASRLGEGHGRPMLAGGATIERLRRLEAERGVFYELADVALDTQDLTLQQVTDKLSDLIRVIREEK
jgi:shikimate kinase